jgi:uncharacterized membrane protein (DUF106 family)
MQPPESTFVLTMMAIGFTVLSNILIRKFVNLDQERRMKSEIDQFNKELKDAMKAKDKKKEEQLRKKEPSIAKMRLKMSNARLKVTLYTFVPFIVIYYGVFLFVGNNYVAVSPWNFFGLFNTPAPNGGYLMAGFWWYLVSSFTFSGMMTRLFKTSP